MAKLFIFAFLLILASTGSVFSNPTTNNKTATAAPPLSEADETALVPSGKRCNARPPNNETGTLPDVPKLGSSTYSNMGSCNGGQGWYGTRINKEKGVHSKNRGQAAACFNNARSDIIRTKWGCYRGSYGECSCVMDSCFIFNYDSVFRDALAALARDTNGYHNNEAERYEYNMYIHYSCKREVEDIDEEFGLKALA